MNERGPMQPINKRRHSGHMHGGGHNGGGRRPYGQQHGGGQGRQGGFQRGGAPRKNFAALREKFMNMAKDAMGQGDRVLAEYYLQHADHYFRMQQEFLAERAANQRLNPPASGNGEQQQEQEPQENEGMTDAEMNNIPNNSNVLPAFLTRQVPQQPQQQNQGDDKSSNGNWEEE